MLNVGFSCTETLLVVICFKDLHIGYSRKLHFADDSNFLHFNSCVKSVKKQANYDLKNLENWLKAKNIFPKCW